MAEASSRLRPPFAQEKERAERLSLLRRELAGLAAPLAAAQRAHVPLGAARLDRQLAGGLATGALHEITCAAPGDAPAAAGFALALAARLRAARPGAPLIWIGEAFAGHEQGALYGPGLALHGLDPEGLVLVQATNAKDALWAMEEALKGRTPAAVIGEIFSAKLYDLTASRRLVLAAQKHGSTGLLCLTGPIRAAALSSSAETRFEIRALSSPPQASAGGRLPLPGPAAFAVRLAKARAGPAGFSVSQNLAPDWREKPGPAFPHPALDRDKFHPVLWNPREVSFRDALSFSLSAVAGDRPDQPPQRRSA
jgi:protein ImuA